MHSPAYPAARMNSKEKTSTVNMAEAEQQTYRLRRIERALGHANNRTQFDARVLREHDGITQAHERGTGLISCPSFFDSTFFTKTSPRICAL